MAETTLEISVDKIVAKARRHVENYTLFVKHAPKLLRQSMMLAYQTAVDDMLKSMDACRTKDPVFHKDEKAVVLLDQNGNAS